MKNNKQQLNETEKQQYADYVKEVTPTHSLWMNMVRAFSWRGHLCHWSGNFELRSILGVG